MIERTSMIERVSEYITCKRNLGYLMDVTDGELLRFARYADGIGHTGPLSVELALNWARLAEHASRLYQARRLEIVRCFAKYEASFEPSTQIPPKGMLGAAHRRIQPYIYTEQEITNLMNTARRLLPINGLRPKTYSTLIGLLACTGLRVCEVLKLNRDDVDTEKALLIVRETKFHKSRIVPLHRSASAALADYARFRDRYLPAAFSARFFLSEQGRAPCYSTVCYTFQKLRNGFRRDTHKSERPPRMYDLRHTFASRRLLKWYHEGADLAHAVPTLSTYLGHVKPTDTYWYITAIAELLAVATRRFERSVETSKGGPR